MVALSSARAEASAQAWISAFNAALNASDAAAIEQLFLPNGHWRNVYGLGWTMRTVNGATNLASELVAAANEVKGNGFALDCGLLAPRVGMLAGTDVFEAFVRFDTVNGGGLGVVRLIPEDGEGVLKAWTFFTTLDMDKVCDAKQGDPALISHHRDFSETGWLEQREQTKSFEGVEPDVLIIGGGHAGISSAVELKRIGLRPLVIDKMKRVGDNWRLRYNGLKLHNKTPVNHLRYMPFPKTWPAYIPKDKLANWLEAYVEGMEVDFWTETTFHGATYDDATQTWTAEVTRADGSKRTFRPKHIVMATSVSGTPHIPKVDTLENFGGKVLHSSQFAAGEEWRGRSVIVLGTGTSAHDISQELEAHGAKVTMVQRSPTLVVNVDPSAQLYDKIYLGDGPSIDVRDMLNASVPLDVVKVSHKLITDEVRKLDAPLHQRLEKAGWRLEFGEGGTGWPLKFRTRGGGYYFNVGASELIADGKIGLIQHADIKQFVAEGVEMKDGSVLKAELVVLATGYKGMDYIVADFFGKEVAERVGKIWDFDPETQELNNMWQRTRQPGLWFTGGAFSQCRIYSRYIALQIDAIENGRLAKAAS